MSDRLEEFLALSPAALETRRANRSLQSETLRMRQGVAIVDISGVLLKRPNQFSLLTGAATYAGIMRNFQIALDDPGIKGILLNVDSPGGVVNGCDELAAAIYAGRGRKPITAFASGQACSAAYWIATAADGIVLSPATEVGSIGVVVGIQDQRVADKQRGVRTVEFVSSRAPDKSPDPNTEPGRKVIQRRVDSLAEVFAAAVARHRGVSVDTVTNDFGRGGVELGANAVRHGMADQVGTFEDALEQLRTGRPISRTRPSAQPLENRTTSNSTGRYTQADVDRAIADAVANQTNRAASIVSSPEDRTGKAASTVHHSSFDGMWDEALGIEPAPAPSLAPKSGAVDFDWDAIFNQHNANRR